MIRALVKELRAHFVFSRIVTGDLDLMTPKNNRVLPYITTNISAKFLKISPSGT
jgi:hypothetical protein